MIILTYCIIILFFQCTASFTYSLGIVVSGSGVGGLTLGLGGGRGAVGAVAATDYG